MNIIKVNGKIINQMDLGNIKIYIYPILANEKIVKKMI